MKIVDPGRFERLNRGSVVGSGYKDLMMPNNSGLISSEMVELSALLRSLHSLSLLMTLRTQ